MSLWVVVFEFADLFVSEWAFVLPMDSWGFGVPLGNILRIYRPFCVEVGICSSRGQALGRVSSVGQWAPGSRTSYDHILDSYGTGSFHSPCGALCTPISHVLVLRICYK